MTLLQWLVCVCVCTFKCLCVCLSISSLLSLSLCINVWDWFLDLLRLRQIPLKAEWKLLIVMQIIYTFKGALHRIYMSVYESVTDSQPECLKGVWISVFDNSIRFWFLGSRLLIQNLFPVHYIGGLISESLQFVLQDRVEKYGMKAEWSVYKIIEKT